MPLTRATARKTPRAAADVATQPPACACGRLRRAARALTQLYDDAMEPAGLRVTQFSLLGTLLRDGPLRISDLAERQLLDRTALSRNLDPLVGHGYVAIVRGRDARTREVAITGKGTAALRKAEPYWTRTQKEVAKRLGAEKLATLIRTLGELESLHPSSAGRPSPLPSPRAAGRGSASAATLPSPRAVGGASASPRAAGRASRVHEQQRNNQR
jgi:DNA-binding MarR family transcriptional regulator